MRRRDQIVDSLERVYRTAFGHAEAREDESAMSRLDLDFQRDQVLLEVLLDIRELLIHEPAADPGGDEGRQRGSGVSGILDTAQKIKNLTKLR